MKNKKIQLKDLKVQSFVTMLEDNEYIKAKGGASRPFCGVSVKIACISQGAQICSDDSC